MTAWYKTGSVAVTNGSATVTGTGTGWASQVKAGDLFTLNRDRFYEVASVASNTSLTLAETYAGSTASGQSYAVVRTSALWHKPAELASQMSDVAEQLGAGATNEWSITKAGAGADAAVTFKTGGTVVARVGAIGSNRPAIEVESGGAFLRGLELTAAGEAEMPLGARVPDGTLAAPGLRFASDTNTGLHRSGSDELALVTAGTARITISNADVRFALVPVPTTNGGRTLGTSTLRWGKMFTTTAVDVSSDSRLKDDWRAESEEPEKVRALLRCLQPCSYRLKGAGDRRRHFGLVAQAVRYSMRSVGYDPADHALWSEDAETGMQSLAYGELIPLLIVGLQDAWRRIEALEAALEDAAPKDAAP